MGDANNDQQISVHMDFNENCRQRQRVKQEQKIKEKEKEIEDEIELERDRQFSILWAVIGLFIGVILLIIIVILMCSKRYNNKLYFSSRQYYRKAHYGELENDNLMDDDSETDTDSSGTYTDDSDLSAELAFDEDVTTGFSESFTTDQ